MIVKSVDDLKLLDDQVQEIELVEFPLLAIEVDLLKRFGELLSLTCTKMYLNDLEFIPNTIQNLAFYNCFIEKMNALKYFTNLYTLSITNCSISMGKIVLPLLEKLDISYSRVEGEEFLLFLDNLEELNICSCVIKNYDFLRSLVNLKRLIIDEDSYNNNLELMRELEQKNILIYDEMGGCYNEV